MQALPLHLPARIAYHAQRHREDLHINAEIERGTLLFFSGTGNSARIAQWMADRLRTETRPTSVHTLDAPLPPAEDLVGPGRLVEVAFPTHGFTAPWIVIKRMVRMPRGLGAQAMVVVLALKGYRPRGVLSVNMPSNWYSLHPMQGTMSHEAIGTRAKGIVEAFVDRIASGRSAWWSSNNLYEFLCGLALAPISMAYLIMGRVFHAKLFFSASSCNGCGVCAQACPVNAITMHGEGKEARPYWAYNCESCMRCAAFCTKKAIEAGHSLGVLMGVAGSVPAAALLFGFMSRRGWVPAGLEAHWYGQVVTFLFWYVAMVGVYAICWQATRIGFVRKLFAWTTLTHYWGRYKEKGTKLKVLRGAAMRKTSGATE